MMYARACAIYPLIRDGDTNKQQSFKMAHNYTLRFI